MKPRGFRWIWLDHVRDHVETGAINGHASHVALALAVYYINGRNEAWPTQRTLATAAGLSEITVRRALHDLERHGFLKRRKGPPATKFGNVYTLSNPIPQIALETVQRDLTDRVSPQRNGVTPNTFTLSDLYVSPLSNVGDQVFTCSSDLTDRVRP